MKYMIGFMDFMRFQPIRVSDFIRQHLPTVVRQECPYFDPMSKKRFGRTLGTFLNPKFLRSSRKWTVIDESGRFRTSLPKALLITDESRQVMITKMSGLFDVHRQSRLTHESWPSTFPSIINCWTDYLRAVHFRSTQSVWKLTALVCPTTHGQQK